MKKSKFILIVILSYFIILILGMAALLISPILRQKGRMDGELNGMETMILEGNFEGLNKYSSLYSYIYVTDSSGQITAFITNSSHNSDEFSPFIDPYVDECLEGNERFHITRSLFAMNVTNLWFINCRLVEISPDSVYAVIFIENMMSIQEALIGNVIFLSVCYWICVFFISRSYFQRKKLDKLRQNYIDNVTHELKAPIASTKILIEALSDNDSLDRDPEKRRFYYGLALRSINKQSHIVNEILELSKLQNNTDMIPKTLLSFDEVFGSVLEKFEATCDCIGINFTLPDNTQNLPVLKTNIMISQVLENIITNATLYSKENDTIHISAEHSKNIVTVCVKDNGKGISKEDQEHIFDRFYRCTNSSSGGSGLGLAICKEIIDRLDEKIWLESELGKGSSFFFTIHT